MIEHVYSEIEFNSFEESVDSFGMLFVFFRKLTDLYGISFDSCGRKITSFE